MEKEQGLTILAIESSCDETAAAVVRDGRQVLSNVIASQIEIHQQYGGVVPEIASRKHIEKINQVIEEALSAAGTTLPEIDAVGVTGSRGLGSQGSCLCSQKAVDRRTSYRRAYFGKLYCPSGFAAAVFMFGCLRGTYAFGHCQGIWCI